MCLDLWIVAMAATGLALHTHAQLLPQRPALACQPLAGRVTPARWGCATLGKAAHRRVQQEVFQVHAAATVDVEAVEAQIRGEVESRWNVVRCS